MLNEQDTARVKALCQELAEMEMNCPRCEGKGGWANLGDGNNILCQNCSGSGKVLLFPGVRVSCPKCGGVRLEGRYTEITCLFCHGKGWVASTDMSVWLEVAKGIGSPFNLSHSAEGGALDDH